MVYPVLSLPFDVISQIFIYALPPESTDVNDALPWRTEAPLLLAGICREWRDIAMCTHDLWNTIYLDLRTHSVLKVAPLLDFWLPRAGNLPLSMSLRYKGDDSPSSAGLDALLKLVAHHAPHWTTIELHIPFEALIQLDSQAENFASLKKLVLNCNSGFHSETIDVARAFSIAPRLRDVHIISGMISATSPARPWQQLVTLRLDNSNHIQCLNALALVPNIVNLTSTLWASGASPTRALHLPRLESLRLLLSHTRGPVLLSSLTLPALHHLEFDLPHTSHIDNVTDLIVRSTCFLRRLSVKLGPLWAGDDFIRLFEAIDSLEELEIRKGGQSVDTAFRLLRAQPSLLPKLKLLHVECIMAEREDAGLIADLLESRWKIPAGASVPVRLGSFRLTSPLAPPDFDSDAVQHLLRLRHLQLEGMEIQITSSSRSRNLLPGRVYQ